MARRIRTWSLLLLAVVAASGAGCSPPDPDLRVLFIGNSYTATNDLPGLVARLADSAGVVVAVESRAPGGWWLRDHAASSETTGVIKSGDWDVVVLQEQSMVPAAVDLARIEMYPPAIALANDATTSGARVILFETWGHRGGSTEVGHSSYESMQAAITNAYADLGDYLRARVAPVGQAWAISTARHPEIALHQPDGSHPTEAGSYLAAVVLTSTILTVPADGLDAAGLDADTAGLLQDAAAPVLPSDGG